MSWLMEEIFFHQAVKNDLRTYDKTQTIATSQGDDHTTGCLLDYPYSKEYCNLISIDLSKQQKLDANPKVIQLIDLPRNLDWVPNTQLFLVIEEEKETVLNFSKGTVKVLWFYFFFNIILILNN